jgi:hypothetical protein
MAYELSLATAGKQVPSGPDWIHEVKHDGYRMLVIRENERVRLFSKNGSDWTRRYPWIAEAALENRQKHFVIDGEAVVLGVDGISDFNALHFRKHDHEVYTPSTFSRWAAMICDRCPYICEGQSGAAAGTSAGRHHGGAFRVRRDRARPISRGLQDGPRRSRIQASRSALPRRPAEALDQGKAAAIRRWIGSFDCQRLRSTSALSYPFETPESYRVSCSAKIAHQALFAEHIAPAFRDVFAGRANH